MEEFIGGDVIVAPFPFSDLTNAIKRPAVVLATLEGDDIILCQITGRSRLDKYFIHLKNKDFTKGSLNVDSIIRPNKLFTIDKSIVSYKVGSLRREKFGEVKKKLIEIIGN